MIQISLAPYHGELIIIDDMNAFVSHFCYSKKQKRVKDEK